MWLNGLFDLWQNLKSYHFIIHIKWRNIANAASVTGTIGPFSICIQHWHFFYSCYWAVTYVEQILRISCSIRLLSNFMFDTDTISSWQPLPCTLLGDMSNFITDQGILHPASVYHCVFQQLFCRLTCRHEPSYTHVHPSYIIHWSCVIGQTEVQH